jgi:hypothetical protein
VLPGLRWLKVLVLEKHDLVLMKATRCYEHDLAAIAEIHARSTSASSYDDSRRR